MASSSAKTASQYLEELPPDRRAELARVRFRKADELPLDLVAEVIAKVSPAELVDRVRALHGSARKTRAAKPKSKR